MEYVKNNTEKWYDTRCRGIGSEVGYNTITQDLVAYKVPHLKPLTNSKKYLNIMENKKKQELKIWVENIIG